MAKLKQVNEAISVLIRYAELANECYDAGDLHFAFLQLNVSLTFATLVNDRCYGILNTAAKMLEIEIKLGVKASANKLIDVENLRKEI